MYYKRSSTFRRPLVALIREYIEVEIQSWRAALASLNGKRSVLLKAKDKCERPGSEFAVPENLLIELEVVNQKINAALDKINQLKETLITPE
jgi:hypothetical protein